MKESRLVMFALALCFVLFSGCPKSVPDVPADDASAAVVPVEKPAEAKPDAGAAKADGGSDAPAVEPEKGKEKSKDNPEKGKAKGKEKKAG